jgi:hypothetical protein
MLSFVMDVAGADQMRLGEERMFRSINPESNWLIKTMLVL